MWKLRRPQQQAQPPLTRSEALRCVPVRNEMVEELPHGTTIQLRYPLIWRPVIKKLACLLRAERRPAHKILELDELGHACWKLIDNQRSVQAIMDEFTHQYSLHPEETRVSVSAFIRELGKRGIVILRMPSP